MHVRGSAYGASTVTHDITQNTRTNIFSQIGRQTELLVRFKTAACERGSADAERPMHGLAVKLRHLAYCFKYKPLYAAGVAGAQGIASS